MLYPLLSFRAKDVSIFIFIVLWVGTHFMMKIKFFAAGFLCICIGVQIYSSFIFIQSAPVPQLLFGHDFVGVVDGVVKVIHGHVSNRDFYNPLGPGVFLSLAFFVKFLDVDILSAVQVFGIYLGWLLSFFLLYVNRFFARSNIVEFGIVSVFVFFVVSSPFQSNFSPVDYSYACFYNRWGDGVFCVLMYSCYRFNQSERDITWIDLFFCGFFCAWLFFIKVSYGLASLVLLIFCLSSEFRSRNSWRVTFGNVIYLTLIVGFWLLIFSILYSSNLFDYVADLRVAAKSKIFVGSSDFLVVFYNLLNKNFFDFIAFFVAAFSVGLVKKLDYKFLIIVFVLAALIDLSNAQNFQNGMRESHILALLLIFLVFDLDFSSFSSAREMILIGVAIVATIMISYPVFLKGVAVVSELRGQSHALQSDTEVFTTGFLKGLGVKGFGGDPPLRTTYVGKSYDGVELLERHGFGKTPVLVLDYSNSINIVRGIVSPKEAIPFLQYGISFREGAAPSVYRVFNNATALMLPKHFGDGNPKSLPVLLDLYGGYISDCYSYVGESLEWVLFKRVCEF